MARRIPHQFAPVSVDMPRDSAIRRSGNLGELAYIRGLLYCQQYATDGFIPGYDLPVVCSGIPKPDKIAGKLVEVDLWQAVTESEVSGFRVRSWLKWNKTAEERSEMRKSRQEGAAKTNHLRHHGDVADPECRYCQQEVNGGAQHD